MCVVIDFRVDSGGDSFWDERRLGKLEIKVSTCPVSEMNLVNAVTRLELVLIVLLRLFAAAAAISLVFLYTYHVAMINRRPPMKIVR